MSESKKQPEEYVYDLNELSPREIMEDFFAQEETKVYRQMGFDMLDYNQFLGKEQLVLF